MDQNPYASPQVPDEQPVAAELRADIGQAPLYKLYSPGQVAWATFLGGPIGGCTLLALNYWKIGQFRAGRLAMVWGIVATACLIMGCFFLPEKFPNTILPAAYTFGMLAIAKSLQGEILERHLASGGQTASTWRATGVGFLCLGAVVVLLFAVGLVLVIVKPEWFPE